MVIFRWTSRMGRWCEWLSASVHAPSSRSIGAPSRYTVRQGLAAFISCREKDFIHIFAALAEFERDILRQRVNAGLKAARRRGRVGGRPKALNEGDLKKARALLRSGDYTKVEVAEELEVSRHTLWRVLSQEAAK